MTGRWRKHKPAVCICQHQHVTAIANPGDPQRLWQEAVQDAVWRPRHERPFRYPSPAGLRLQRLPHLGPSMKRAFTLLAVSFKVSPPMTVPENLSLTTKGLICKTMLPCNVLFLTSQGCAAGLACRTRAAAPTTCGAAIEVPDITLHSTSFSVFFNTGHQLAVRTDHRVLLYQ